MAPRIGDKDFTELDGVNKVAVVANRARCLWRPTPTKDVGIDGQIEHVAPDGEPSGRLIAVQVKSGDSYFRGEKDDRVPYRVEAKHAAYWAGFTLPVVLVLHREDRDLTIWADARSALRRGENPVRVSLANAFDPNGVHQALRIDGPLPEAARDPRVTLAEMSSARFLDLGMNVSFLDLFSHGLTDIARSLYFGMDLFQDVGETNASLEGHEGGTGFGQAAFAFLDAYVGFLVARDVARVDFDAWRQMAVELDMVGKFVAPLTSTGRALVSGLTELNAELPENARGNVTEERLIRFLPLRMEERAAALLEIAAKLERDGSDGATST